MNKETLRMQMLSGVITEGEYKAKLEENKKSLNEHYVAGGIVGVGAINQIPSREKSDYEMAFDYFLKNEKNTLKEEDEKGVTGPTTKFPQLAAKIPGIELPKFKNFISKVKAEKDITKITDLATLQSVAKFLDWLIADAGRTDLTAFFNAANQVKSSDVESTEAGKDNLEEVDSSELETDPQKIGKNKYDALIKAAGDSQYTKDFINKFRNSIPNLRKKTSLATWDKVVANMVQTEKDRKEIERIANERMTSN